MVLDPKTDQYYVGENARLLAHWQGAGAASRPDVWFTYHLYYKASDLVGPQIAAALRIPYLAAEASYAGKRNRDGWRPWQAEVETALAACDVIFCYTQADRDGLADAPAGRAQLRDLPPFIDTAAFTDLPPKLPSHGALRLIASAMMRSASNKVESYQFLAQALHHIRDRPWHLTIVGDGPARAEVEQAFTGLPAKAVTWCGQLERAALIAQLSAADLFVWPGVREAYGLVYLEAQAAGLPVLALDDGGVASTLLPGVTGQLVTAKNPRAYAQALCALADDRQRLSQMGRDARAFVLGQRGLAPAACLLADGVRAAMQGRTD